ncbi:MAG TPA: SCO family protein [Gammaproteobacteria bacterium]
MPDDALHTPGAAAPRRPKWLVPGLVLLALVAGITVGLLLRPGGIQAWLPPPEVEGVLRGPFTLGGEFELTDHAGGRTRLSDLRGNVVLLFFGYTHCPDICPSLLADLRLALGRLGEHGERVRALFVSVDPERDGPEQLRAYVTPFGPRFLGLTGSAEELAAVARRFGAAYEIEPHAPGARDYEVAHSAFTYLIDAQGTVQVMVRYGTPWEALADEIARLL